MDAKKREIRTIECQLSVREQAPDAQGESRTIEGTAIVFNTESEVLDDWGTRFREVILPEAVTMEFLNTQDVKANLLHERELTLARNNKNAANSTLHFTVDERGLHFEFEAPKCDIGDRALELVRNGVYSGCSFEFYPKDYDEKVEGDDVTIYHRSFERLTAITIGMDPVYTATSVNAREIIESTDEYKAKQREQEQRDKEAMQREMERRVETLSRLSNFDEILDKSTY